MRKSLLNGLFAVCSVATLALARQSVGSTTEPGMLPYAPTRLEWLALDLEASYHQDFSRDSDYSLHYISKPPNTVVIYVHYVSEASAGTVDNAIDTAKQLVDQDASTHGWSSWVKVQVQRRLVKK